MNFYLSSANAFLFVGYKWMLDRSSDFLFGRILSENCTCGKEQDVCLMTYINPVCLVPPQGSPLSLQEEGRGGGD